VRRSTLLAALALGLPSCDAGVGPSPLPTRPIVFVARSTATPACDGLWSVEADGTSLTELTGTPGCKFTPAVSPNGTRIAFSGEGPPAGIEVAQADGTHGVALETADELDWYPAWSPDGSRIAFTSNSRGGDTTSAVWVMNADGSGAHHVVTPGRLPTWSPDGRQLAYEGGDCQIWLVNVDGSNPHPLRQGGCQADTLQYQPAWSPTALRIATSSHVPVTGGSAIRILTMGADGSSPRVLTDGADDTQPAWSPDGDHLVFLRLTKPYLPPVLSVIRADGTDLRQVTAAVVVQHPTW